MVPWQDLRDISICWTLLAGSPCLWLGLRPTQAHYPVPAAHTGTFEDQHGQNYDVFTTLFVWTNVYESLIPAGTGQSLSIAEACTRAASGTAGETVQEPP